MPKNVIIIFVIIILIILLSLIIFRKITLKNEDAYNVSYEHNDTLVVEETTEQINEDDIDVIEDEKMTNNEIQISIIVNNNTYKATLYNSQTVQELISHFPMTITMSELNSNEKYYYLDYSITTNSYVPDNINSGDIKLYGDNCLVVFYKDFTTSYSYTDIGKVENVDSFVKELGSGSVTMTFKLD